MRNGLKVDGSVNAVGFHGGEVHEGVVCLTLLEQGCSARSYYSDFVCYSWCEAFREKRIPLENPQYAACKMRSSMSSSTDQTRDDLQD